MLLSLGGFVTGFFLWINLGTLARVVGTIRALVAILFSLARRSYTMLPGEAV